MDKSKYDWVEVVCILYFLSLGKTKWEEWASIEVNNDAEEAFRSFYHNPEINSSINNFIKDLEIMSYTNFDTILEHLSYYSSFAEILKAYLFCTFFACDNNWTEEYLEFIKSCEKDKQFWEKQIFIEWKFEYIDEYVIEFAKNLMYQYKDKRIDNYNQDKTYIQDGRYSYTSFKGRQIMYWISGPKGGSLYDSAYVWSSQNGYFRTICRDGIWAYISAEDCVFNYLPYDVDYAEDFSCGRALIKKKTGYYYIDLKLQIVSKCYEKASNYTNGIACVSNHFCKDYHIDLNDNVIMDDINRYNDCKEKYEEEQRIKIEQESLSSWDPEEEVMRSLKNGNGEYWGY